MANIANLQNSDSNVQRRRRYKQIAMEEGVYDKDPSKFDDAKLLKTLSFETLYKINRGRRVPGMNFIFDPQAGVICKNNGIKVIVTNKISDVACFIKGKEFSGTLIE